MGGEGFPLLPIYAHGTAENSSFALWTDLLLQLRTMKIPQYTKYSEIFIA